MNGFEEAFAWLADPVNWAGPGGVPTRLGEHVFYTVVTILIAGVIAVPIGLAVGHTGRGKSVVLLLSNAARALPTLGLLTLVVLMIGIGLAPPIIALVVLAVPPLLAAIYSGIESVDPVLVDAGRAIGFTEWQLLTRVEVPLSLPILLGGLRAATLQVIATATVAAYVAFGGVGRYLIDGLALNDYGRVVAGSLLVIALALTSDGIFALVQRRVVSPGLRKSRQSGNIVSVGAVRPSNVQ